MLNISHKNRRFIRHYIEMVAVMFAGMVVLGFPGEALLSALGTSSGELQENAPAVALLAMATIMTGPMVAYMRRMGHSWRRAPRWPPACRRGRRRRCLRVGGGAAGRHRQRGSRGARGRKQHPATLARPRDGRDTRRAMSRGNVERLRGAFDDFLTGRRDFGAELLDSNVEWDSSEMPVPDIAVRYQGIEGVRQFWRDWLGAWESVDFDYELVDAGDRVVALIDQRMRGRSTGIEIAYGKYAQVYTFENGLIVHWKAYLSQSEALEAVGLRE